MEPAKDPSADFRVFTGEYELTSQFLFGRHEDGEPKHNVSLFYKWLDNLHNGLDNKKDVGIPPKYVDSALRLLDGFFPIPLETEPRKRTMIRMKPTNTTDKAVEEKLNPITVEFESTKINIADGPGALAYVFSVAAPQTQPPQTSAFANQWVIPLLAALSRCIYLAYVYGDIIGTKPTESSIPDVQSVPLMSCAMWFTEPKSDVTYYLLGSTYVTGINTANGEVSNAVKRKLMNAWRRDELIGPQLATFDPVRALPHKDSPFFISPTLQGEVEDLLLRALKNEELSTTSTQQLNMKLPPTVTPLSGNDKTLWVTVVAKDVDEAAKKAGKQLKDTYTEACDKVKKSYCFEAIDPKSILDNKKTTLRGSLRDGLSKALRVIWTLKGEPPKADDTKSNEDLKKAFEQVFSAFFVPHYYEAEQDPKTKRRNIINWSEIVIDGRDGIAATLFDTLWTQSTADKIIQMACRIYHWVMKEDDSLVTAGGQSSRWGRCAETHPGCGLMYPGIVTRQMLSMPNPSNVMGIAMEIRNFNNEQAPGDIVDTFKLADNLSWDKLAEFHKDRGHRLFRLPCVNCQLLLPALDIPTGKTNYDTVLYSKFPDFDDEQKEENEKKNKNKNNNKNKGKDKSKNKNSS